MKTISQCCQQSQPPNRSLDETITHSIQQQWYLPQSPQLNLLISMINGNCQSIHGQQVINIILANIDQQMFYNNVPYALKTLIIVDFVVEDRIFLPKIKDYTNNQLLFIKPSIPSQPNRNIIASYYLYLTKKAKYYQLQSPQLIVRESRQKHLSQINLTQILKQVNICFKIQKLILDVNDSYPQNTQYRNIIYFIFQLMLKTYLACHSIVTIAIKILTTKIPNMNLYDLQYMNKFITFYNGEYQSNIRKFIQKNQQISSFKTVSLNELLLINSKVVQQFVQSQIQQSIHESESYPKPQKLTITSPIQIINQKNSVQSTEQLNTKQTIESQTSTAIQKFNKTDNNSAIHTPISLIKKQNN